MTVELWMLPLAIGVWIMIGIELLPRKNKGKRNEDTHHD